MSGQFLLSSHETSPEPNIYADKSSLILEWLLLIGIEKNEFSIREVAAQCCVSVGLVQKVFGVLTRNGYLKATGLRTAKKFALDKPEILLRSWLEHYNISKKCKMRTYRTALSGRDQLLNALQQSPLQHKVVLALHSAVELLGCKNTNLQTLEVYLLQPDIRTQLEEILQLEPQERGYEVLLIEPHYKSMLQSLQETSHNNIKATNFHYSSLLLTYLDLYHFPLRGREQADFMAQRKPELKRIYKRR